MSSICLVGNLGRYRAERNAPPPPWGPPQVEVFGDFISPDSLVGLVNDFMARDDINLLAVSPALPGTAGNAGEHWVSLTITVVYQQRAFPNGQEDGNE